MDRMSECTIHGIIPDFDWIMGRPMACATPMNMGYVHVVVGSPGLKVKIRMEHFYLGLNILILDRSTP